MLDYKKELNDEQYEVVTNGDGACLVLAGAGSGKTRTITYRVVYLLEQGVAPDEILLVTFTNKAANEMVERVAELTGSSKKLPWSGTFHSIAYKILQQYASVLGYQSQFTILDSADSRDLIKLCVKQEGVDRKSRRFPSVRVLQSIISYARNAEQTIEQVVDDLHPQWIDLHDTIGRIAEDYHKRKREANAMDFDDLLVNLHLLLLKSSSVRERFAGRFKYVLVDEYQDTNRVQAEIVRLFASVHKNILVVGDDAQSIYSFRAADIQNILAFEKNYSQARIFRLEVNYRSTPEILSLANNVIAQNVEQYEKELRSFHDTFAKPEVHAFADTREEAVFIADRILELRDEDVDMNKIAVLFRAAFHSQSLEMELTKRDIPYEFRGGTRFFARAHIKDVLAYLRIFANRRDTIAWSRILNMQVGIGPASVDKLLVAIAEKKPDEDIVNCGSVLSARGQLGWSDFLQVFEAVQSADGTPAGLIRAVIDSKYAEYLEFEHQDYRERLQDLEQLALYAERQPKLAPFLAEASMQESYAAAQSRDADREEERVVLSTVHQAKGLEWDAVFVMGLAAGRFPNDKSLSSREGTEEERRLFYVAITRARRFLHLTYPLMSGFRSILQGPSMFVEELDRALVSLEGMAGESIFDDPSDDVDDIEYVPEFDDSSFGRKGFLKDIGEL